jgi:tetratricopeptide (TPR) repeat protein
MEENGRHWERLEQLFAAAADLPPDQQIALIGQETDPELRRELRELLDHDRGAKDRIAQAIESAALTLDWAGRRAGPYRIVREIGRGGMGLVFEAVRDDDEYRKTVALKIAPWWRDLDLLRERFRQERQILAGLEHPNIARFLDGGTHQGVPYFAMEFVEGRRIMDYALQLKLQEKVELFRQVCSAVQYAHQSLVVHRDLKPANILVTEEGVPKLLDFGIAKLLSPFEEDSTVTRVSPWTPDYASPEQVRARPVTTRTDVYSLGLILFEMLTGERAQAADTSSPLALDSSICEREIPRASTKASRACARQLAGDLDTIVAKATQKDPQRRYASVAEFSDDLHRYLDGRPVCARKDSAAYRARKFVIRNRAPIAAGIIFVATLVAGASVAFNQARRAEHESWRARENQEQAELNRKDAEAQARAAESERRAAESAREMADRRFEQVRQLAGKFLVDFHDSIAGLPGSTGARKMVVETGLRYYDTLVQDARGDRDLLEEIARGYDRLGDAQGNATAASVRDTDGALASYQKSRAIREAISDPSPQFQIERIRGSIRIAQAQTEKGEIAQSQSTLRKVIVQAQRGPNASAFPVRQALADAYRVYGDSFFSTASFDGAIEPYLKYLDLCNAMARSRANSLADQACVGLAHMKLGRAYVEVNRNREASEHVRAAIDAFQHLAEREPNNSQRTRQLYNSHAVLADVLTADPALGAPGEQKKNLEIMVELANRMSTADPNNNTARFDVMRAQAYLGDWLKDHEEFPAAILAYRNALESIENFASAGQPGLFAYDALVFAHQRLASGFARSGQLEQALEEIRSGEEYLTAVERIASNTNLTSWRHAELIATRALAYEQRKIWLQAIADYKQAIGIREELRKRDAKNRSHLNEIAGLLSHLADCYAGAGERDAAVRTIETSLDRLREIGSMRVLTQQEGRARKDAEAKLTAWVSQ